MRITKDRETRKAELVNASIDLFLEKGYEATMVSDVVRRVGVAQGTFYYYFASKEDVLDAALGRLLQESAERVKRLAQDDAQPVLQRLESLFRLLFSPRGSAEVQSHHSRLLQDPVVIDRMETVRLSMMHEVLAQLLEEGARNGEFRELRFPSEIAGIALRGASGFMRDRQALLTASLGIDASMEALAEFMENLLGLPCGSLDFRDRVIRRQIG